LLSTRLNSNPHSFRVPGCPIAAAERKQKLELSQDQDVSTPAPSAPKRTKKSEPIRDIIGGGGGGGGGGDDKVEPDKKVTPSRRTVRTLASANALPKSEALPLAVQTNPKKSSATSAVSLKRLASTGVKNPKTKFIRVGSVVGGIAKKGRLTISTLSKITKSGMSTRKLRKRTIDEVAPLEDERSEEILSAESSADYSVVENVDDEIENDQQETLSIAANESRGSPITEDVVPQECSAILTDSLGCKVGGGTEEDEDSMDLDEDRRMFRDTARALRSLSGEWKCDHPFPRFDETLKFPDTSGTKNVLESSKESNSLTQVTSKERQETVGNGLRTLKKEILAECVRDHEETEDVLECLFGKKEKEGQNFPESVTAEEDIVASHIDLSEEVVEVDEPIELEAEPTPTEGPYSPSLGGRANDDDVENLLRIERCCATVRSMVARQTHENTDDVPAIETLSRPNPPPLVDSRTNVIDRRMSELERFCSTTFPTTVTVDCLEVTLDSNVSEIELMTDEDGTSLPQEEVVQTNVDEMPLKTIIVQPDGNEEDDDVEQQHPGASRNVEPTVEDIGEEVVHSWKATSNSHHTIKVEDELRSSLACSRASDPLSSDAKSLVIPQLGFETPDLFDVSEVTSDAGKPNDLLEGESIAESECTPLAIKVEAATSRLAATKALNLNVLADVVSKPADRPLRDLKSTAELSYSAPAGVGVLNPVSIDASPVQVHHQQLLQQLQFPRQSLLPAGADSARLHAINAAAAFSPVMVQVSLAQALKQHQQQFASPSFQLHHIQTPQQLQQLQQSIEAIQQQQQQLNSSGSAAQQLQVVSQQQLTLSPQQLATLPQPVTLSPQQLSQLQQQIRLSPQQQQQLGMLSAVQHQQLRFITGQQQQQQQQSGVSSALQQPHQLRFASTNPQLGPQLLGLSSPSLQQQAQHQRQQQQLSGAAGGGRFLHQPTLSGGVSSGGIVSRQTLGALQSQSVQQLVASVSQQLLTSTGQQQFQQQLRMMSAQNQQQQQQLRLASGDHTPSSSAVQQLTQTISMQQLQLSLAAARQLSASGSQTPLVLSAAGLTVAGCTQPLSHYNKPLVGVGGDRMGPGQDQTQVSGGQQLSAKQLTGHEQHQLLQQLTYGNLSKDGHCSDLQKTITTIAKLSPQDIAMKGYCFKLCNAFQQFGILCFHSQLC